MEFLFYGKNHFGIFLYGKNLLWNFFAMKKNPLLEFFFYEKSEIF